MATDREGMTTEAGNPYFAPQLASAVVDLPDAATAGDPAVDVTTLTLGSHTLRLQVATLVWGRLSSTGTTPSGRLEPLAPCSA
ncbi:MAG: hypothetical protein R2710_18505 [Acidimicrobiales bacterium]